MNEVIIQAFVSSGWAGVSLALVAWILRDSKERETIAAKRHEDRENRLMRLIEEDLRAIRQDVAAIRDDIHDTGPLAGRTRR